jgi:hypothetical protein
MVLIGTAIAFGACSAALALHVGGFDIGKKWKFLPPQEFSGRTIAMRGGVDLYRLIQVEIGKQPRRNL